MANEAIEPPCDTNSQAEPEAEAVIRALMEDLVRLRKRRKIRQQSIADALQVSQARVSQLEHVAGGVPLESLLVYAHAIGADLVIVPRKDKNRIARGAPEAD